ncbi:MAG: hypothetical protein KGI78_04425 [Patescibacteria group bacterium]|nr:hypothetical protein [Patescibacteria group bacterium]MDE1945345.1 hypothetical protein [Patescibacteria group bacterium]MDE2058056.1 hypothetical protein [Patescibacteria group bacterium]
MLLVPAALVYVATAALVVVCALAAVLLFYLIRLAKTVSELASRLDWEGRRLSHGFARVRRAVQLALASFG